MVYSEHIVCLIDSFMVHSTICFLKPGTYFIPKKAQKIYVFASRKFSNLQMHLHNSSFCFWASDRDELGVSGLAKSLHPLVTHQVCDKRRKLICNIENPWMATSAFVFTFACFTASFCKTESEGENKCARKGRVFWASTQNRSNGPRLHACGPSV